MTITQTFTAIIKDKAVIVNEIYKGGQDISYTVNGRAMTSEQYWKLRPVKVN